MELVVPGAYYLVRMLDGRIDTHGTIKDLRAQGILDDSANDAEAEVQKERDALIATEIVSVEEAAAEGDGEDSQKDDAAAKKPRKLVKDEHRETGGVKWSIYNSYLKAS